MAGAYKLAAGASGGAGFFPEFFPVPDAVGYFAREWESNLVSDHADLAAMMGFVGQHVAEHFQAHRPRWAEAVPFEFLDATFAIAECFHEHLGAPSGALGQCRAGLLRSAASAVQLLRNFEMRSAEPDPLGANVVHVGEDRDDGTRLAGGLGIPRARVEMFDEHLVHALTGGKDLDCGPAELSVNRAVKRLIGSYGHFTERISSSTQRHSRRHSGPCPAPRPETPLPPPL